MDRIYDAHGNMSKEESDYLGDKAYKMMEAYLLDNGWKESYNDTWIKKEDDENIVRGLSTVAAYRLATEGPKDNGRLYTIK